MAQINKPSDYFNTKLYTGNATNPTTISGIGFQPDWVWTKLRAGGTEGHRICDSVRGATKDLITNTNAAETTNTIGLKEFNNDGYVIGNSNGYNLNSGTFVSWNWLAGGTTPTKTYTVKVVSDSGNKYRFDDFGTSAVTLDLQEGGTYTFDQSDSSNSGHPFRFSTTSDGSHGGGSEYTTGVTTTGTPGSSGAKTVITVAASAPTLYYYCTQHSGMGGQANTNSTFGSSNFDGSIQTTVSANTTSGFSVVKYAGSQGSNFTVGHGLSSPKLAIVKSLSAVDSWGVYYNLTGTNTNWMQLNDSTAVGSNNSDPDANGVASGAGGYTGYYAIFNASTMSVSSAAFANGGTSLIGYFFQEVNGFSKIGMYKGNGSNDGTFVYTGFKPAWVMVKRADTANDWNIQDTKRQLYNGQDGVVLQPNTDSTESTIGNGYTRDMLSNGFKIRQGGTETNASGGTYIYLAFAENPLVGTNNTPTTAR